MPNIPFYSKALLAPRLLGDIVSSVQVRLAYISGSDCTDLFSYRSKEGTEDRSWSWTRT